MLDLHLKNNGPLGTVLDLLYPILGMVLVVAVLEVITAFVVKNKLTRELLHIVYIIGLLAGIWFYTVK